MRWSLDCKLFAAKIKIGNEFNINAIKEENLFYNNKTDENNNNIE